jgi:hypothetical protein
MRLCYNLGKIKRVADAFIRVIVLFEGQGISVTAQRKGISRMSEKRGIRQRGQGDKKGSKGD